MVYYGDVSFIDVKVLLMNLGSVDEYMYLIFLVFVCLFRFDVLNVFLEIWCVVIKIFG